MKRKVSLVLTLALLLLVFAGCQRNLAAEGHSATDTPKTNTDQTAAATDGTHSSATDTGAASVADILTPEDAEKRALEHAGFTADQVTRLHTEPDLNDYIPHYDVEFHKDNYEYDYEINAQTGEILKSEREWD